MLITREADYAIRLISGLSDGQNHPVKALCETEAVPWKFAYKIMKKLKDAKLVRSTSGVHGGCRLVADLHDVTLLDLITIIQEKQYINDCLKPGYECTWEEENHARCPVHDELIVMQKKLDQELSSHTLWDLVGGRESGESFWTAGIEGEEPVREARIV